MPNTRHFEWSEASCSLLSLPRPTACPSLGCLVQLTAGAWEDGILAKLSDSQRKAVLDGPLAPGDVGQVLDDVASGEAPFLVQELVSGRLWWYPEPALQPVAAGSAPQDVQHPAAPGEGSYVTLTADYRTFSDASRGPLNLLRTEDAYGLVVLESGNRFRVRCCNGRGSDWWYDSGAVRPVHLMYVPESLRAAVRPGWGDYVALTHDHGSFGTAVDGPLEPGNLGVVVAVRDVADSKGGLMRSRYTVRTCHNEQAYRYHEGALHLVVQQLLHKPKHPPPTATGCAKCLECSISITEAVSGDAVPCSQVLSRGEVQQVQQVVPGHKYWIAVTVSCQDGDLMLANLKPCSFDLYAPTGVPGQYVHLPPVPCAQPQQQQKYGGVKQQQGPELQSLASCHGAAGAAAAAAGSSVWYNAVDDEVFCVFEWDSAETPLALRTDRVTAVDFVWAACFKHVSGQAKQQQRVLLQTVAASTPQSTPAAVSPSQPGSMVQELPERACGTCSTPTPAAAPQYEWLEDIMPATPAACRRRRGYCSSSDGEDECSSDDGSDSGEESCSCCGSSSSDDDSEAEDGESAADVAARRNNRRSGRGLGRSAAAGGAGRATRPGSSSSGSSAAAPPTPPASVSPGVPEANISAPSGSSVVDGSAAGVHIGSSPSSDSNRAAGQHVAAAQQPTSSSSGVQQQSVSTSSLSVTSSRPPTATAPASWAAVANSSAGISGRPSLRLNSSRSSIVSRSSSTVARAADASTSTATGTARRSRNNTAAAAAGSGDLLNIQEIMRQFESQAESDQPFWQPGTELAAELAAKAIAAAEEWQQDWCRPRDDDRSAD